MQPDQTMDPAVRDLLYQLKFGSNAQRNEAIQTAPLIGSKAVPHLARLMDKWATPGQFRGAQEAMKRIAMNGYRPRGEENAITGELIKLIGPDQPVSMRREALALLGFAAGTSAVTAITTLLRDSELREDARMALERNPSRSAESALRASAGESSGEWKDALEYSIRRRKTSFKDVGTRR